MARCDEGYLCEVCGEEVERIVDSDLYLRFVMGEIPITALPSLPERHIRCNPAIAQYIVAPDFPPVVCEGPFAKENLDPEFVREQEERTTRAWRRLQQLQGSRLPLSEYPLPEVRQRRN